MLISSMNWLQRKYTTLLNKALEQKEIKEGLIKATNIIDLIIRNNKRFTKSEAG